MRKIMIMILCGIMASHTYTATTVVTDIERENNTVVCEDATGNIWAFYGIKGWKTGDMCQLRMHDAGTGNVTDDIILWHTYIGTTEMIEKESAE